MRGKFPQGELRKGAKDFCIVYLTGRSNAPFCVYDLWKKWMLCGIYTEKGYFKNFYMMLK